MKFTLLCECSGTAIQGISIVVVVVVVVTVHIKEAILYCICIANLVFDRSS